ncbi:MAG TPA: C39 family peptidase [Candidatus Mediterraneibacter stercoripullorum]|nr:C39 family peptidase [Candidatus Mediterraneibacter stercoripullorum]
MARSNDAVRKILEQPELYPDELLEMLAGNEEAAQFVLDYPEKKDNAPADSIGDVTQGEIPLLLQWDERWGYGAYGNSMIAISGCGPTVVAMVSAGLLGDSSITPYKVAQYAQDHGYYVEGTGTSWSLMTEGARQFGVQGQELGLSESSIVSELENGHPIICSMRPGDFTTSGHFIVLTGVENGKIRVNDPNSKVNSEKLWDYDRLESQINNLWSMCAL